MSDDIPPNWGTWVVLGFLCMAAGVLAGYPLWATVVGEIAWA